MNEIMIKEFDGNKVEIIEIDGELYFEIYSTGMALGQVKVNSQGNLYPRKDRIDDNLRNIEITPCVHNGHEYINEQQLYDLMLEMKTDRVKPFRKWLTGEVLPSIRKHGTYMTDEVLANTLDDPDFIISLATKLKEERLAKQKLAQQIEALSENKINILLNDISKSLKLLTEEKQNANFPTSISAFMLKEYSKDPSIPRTFQYFREEIYHNLQFCPYAPFSSSYIAKAYGLSTAAFNRKLQDLKIHTRNSYNNWALYPRYQNQGYKVSGVSGHWSPYGVKFLYQYLNNHGVRPIDEIE